MRILVIYDIPGDRPRTKVADVCLDYGLERIQYSAFVGALGRAHVRELEVKVARLLEREPAKVRFIPVDERSWEQQWVIERPGVAEIAGVGVLGDRVVVVGDSPDARRSGAGAAGGDTGDTGDDEATTQGGES